MRVIVTGAAGFIGYHTARKLLDSGHSILGVDNLNDYYDPKYKTERLSVLSEYRQFEFKKLDIANSPDLSVAWKKFQPDHCIHLAAQAGVRYSITNPGAYIHSNIVGFQNVLDLVKETSLRNFVYASSSSVYGGITQLPFTESMNINNPLSLYAASKIANEVFAKSYCNLYGISATGLRFFTVYGPISRPDMAMFKFAELMRENKPIPVYNDGNMIRDWTYVDDIVSGILGALAKPEHGGLYNLGKGRPDKLMDMINSLQELLGISAKLELMPMQNGDVPATQADINLARNNISYEPKTSLHDGMREFCKWYKQFWKLA